MKVTAILASLVVFGSALGAGTTASAQMSSSQTAALEQVQATAKSAWATIQSSPQELKLMTTAIKMQSVSQSRAILLRHGFTAQVLQEGVIVFSHAVLPKKVRNSEFYYLLLSYSPFKITAHGLP
jgi:hypothetical protein